MLRDLNEVFIRYLLVIEDPKSGESLDQKRIQLKQQIENRSLQDDHSNSHFEE